MTTSPPTPGKLGSMKDPGNWIVYALLAALTAFQAYNSDVVTKADLEAAFSRHEDRPHRGAVEKRELDRLESRIEILEAEERARRAH